MVAIPKSLQVALPLLGWVGATWRRGRCCGSNGCGHRIGGETTAQAARLCGRFAGWLTGAVAGQWGGLLTRQLLLLLELLFLFGGSNARAHHSSVWCNFMVQHLESKRERTQKGKLKRCSLSSTYVANMTYTWYAQAANWLGKQCPKGKGWRWKGGVACKRKAWRKGYCYKVSQTTLKLCWKWALLFMNFS